MPNLESFLAHWRQTLANGPRLNPATLDELESHLRERIEQLVQSGLSETDACQRAAAELGSPESIAAEFRKLNASSWLPVKIVSGAVVALALALAILLVARPFTGPGAGLLLGIHVFVVTLGYATTILLGVLGACCVLQRACADFPPVRLASLARVTFGFAAVATVCTALGVLLGMIWAHREWGRFWGWDAKEIGGLCVVLWILGFLVAHRFRWVTPRALLVASTLGSNVVFLAWFAPSLAPGLHAHGLPHAAWLLISTGLILNLLLALLGLAPAGCLRPRKA
jgi:hypothetical protein